MRRIVTARQQVDMLSPWRTAAPGGAKRRTTTQDVIDAVRAQHGINLEMVNTGGGCYVLQGRLEDGSWVRAADKDDFCYPELADRHFEEERDGEPLGWDVDIYPNEHDPGGTSHDGKLTWGPSDNWGGEPIHSHSDASATVDDLPRVISDAFRTMPHDAKRVQQDKLREELTRDGWEPGDSEWERWFPGEGGKSIDVPTELPPAGRKPHSLGDEDYGDIFGKQSMRTASLFDWQRSQKFRDSDSEFAHLENGDQLGLFSAPSHDPDRGWDWYLWTGPKDEDGNRAVTGGGMGWDGDDRAHAVEHYPTIDHARAAAEAAYQALHPLGTSTGSPRDSGVDYGEALRGMRPPLDDDFGDIFGKESMRRAAGFDWMPSGGGPSDDGGEEAHTELGDLVQTHHAYPGGHWRPGAKPIGHGYSIWEWDDSDPDDKAYEEFANSGGAVYPTHEEAKKAAEEHYYRIDHSKRKRGESGMDSGVDYDAILKPKPLDDDFGDIFGGG